MRVRVLFFGVLKELAGRSEEDAEVAPGTTVGGLFEQYVERFATLRGRHSSILVARNREFATRETEIADRDEIAFLPPVSGGSAEAASGLIYLTRGPLDAHELARKVQRGEDGAVVTFEGVVRNNSQGRQTLYLEYECYEAMALAGMKRIAAEIAAGEGVGQVAMAHRLGRLAIGEASVAIAVSAPHRRPAFAAALLAIDRLKREVPIWKKEFFTDGEMWVEGDWDEALVAASGDGSEQP